MNNLQSTDDASLEEYLEISQFLYREADILDDRQYREWLSLLADNIEYRVPVRHYRQPDGSTDDWALEKELSPPSTLQMTENRYTELELRVERLLSGKARTENPPWFTQRIITNIRVSRGDSPGEYRVSSKFLLNRYKSGRDQTMVGSRLDAIKRLGSDLRLCSRCVLFNADSYRWGSYALI